MNPPGLAHTFAPKPANGPFPSPAHLDEAPADAVDWAPERVFVFELRLRGTAEEALQQIDFQTYAVPYATGARAVVKAGVESARAERNPGRWLVKAS